MACAVSMAGAITIQSVGPADNIGAFDRHEWSVDPGQRYANPFDPEQIAIDATFTAPDGRTVVLPAFWDQRQSGSGFFLRFSPTSSGRWSMAVTVRDAAGPRRSDPIGFDVSASHRKGFIRGASNKRYLQYDSGDSYFAVGLNLCWPKGETVASWYDGEFATLAANGGNFARVWMCHPPVFLETLGSGLGKFNTDHAAYFDHVLEAADRNGIAVMLCMVNHREFLERDMWGKAGWDDNPYNAKNGGPATRPVDFFTSDVAAAHFKARLRYMVARYSAFTSLGFWELFNEQEGLGFTPPDSWNAAMASYLRQADPYRHLVTTSAQVPDASWQLADIDLTQTHIYGDGSVVETTAPIQTAVRENAKFNKPHLIGEMGLDYKGSDTPFDPHGLGTAFHNSIWAGAMAGNAGTAMYWWWDNYVEPKNLWHELKPVSAFVQQIDWAHSDFRPVNVQQIWHEDAGDATTDLTIATSGGWGETNHGTIVVPANGRPEATPAHYLYGPQHPELRAAMAFELELPVNSVLKVAVSGVSDCAFVRASIDGKPVRDFPLSALPGSADVTNARYREQDHIYQSDVNKEFAVELPEGRHVVSIDVPAGDWVSVSRVTFTNAMPARYANLAALVLQDRDSRQTLGWILDTRSNWQHDQAEPNLAADGDVRIVVPGVTEGRFMVDWFDTRTGRGVGSESVAASEGKLVLKVPAFVRDVAWRLRAGT